MVPVALKSPTLEKGQAHQVLTRRPASWTSSWTWRSRLRWTGTACCLVSVALFVTLRQSRVGPRLLSQIIIYRLVKGLNPLDSTILDVTKSRQHKVTLRPSVTYEIHNLEASGVFADWYGNPSEVGSSPFDYAIPPEWQTSLSGRKRWRIASDTSCKQEDDNEMCDIAAALASSSRRSIERGDLVVTPVKNTDVQLRHGAAASFVPSTAKLDIQLLNECAGHNCTRQLDLSHGGCGKLSWVQATSPKEVAYVGPKRHAFELIDLFEYPKLKAMYGTFDMQLFGHLPYAADPARFYPSNQWDQKTVDYLDVDGVLDKKDKQNLPLPKDYRKAKLCLFNSTPKKRMSREWIKAMLSGCVIVSDMPSESEEVLSEAIITYDASATEAEIGTIIVEALKDSADLKRKALRAFIHARRWHTPAYQAGYILQLSELHRAGERGYDFPMPFAAICRVYPDGTKPSWC